MYSTRNLDFCRNGVYNMGKEYKLSPETIKKIENVLNSKGDRIELIPCKDGVIKVIQEIRAEVK